MADKSALAIIGLMFGAATLFVTMVGTMVVSEHLTGRLHIEDGIGVLRPMAAR